MTVAEAAAALDVDARRVRALISRGQLPAEKVGSMWLVAPAAVDARRRERPSAGRPLSPQLVWWMLAHLDGALNDGGSAPTGPTDRRVRHRLRSVEASSPDVERWGSWLRRRGAPRRVWFHPGVVDRVVTDRRVVRPDLSGILGLPMADLGSLYVAAADFDDLRSALHGTVGSDDEAAIPMMVVPEMFDGPPWRKHVAAAALVDLVGDADARVAHAAQTLLRSAATEHP